jgi:hypothetical protein
MIPIQRRRGEKITQRGPFDEDEEIAAARRPAAAAKIWQWRGSRQREDRGSGEDSR